MAMASLIQRPSLRNLSNPLSGGPVETCLLLFLGRITGSTCELEASLMPFLCQPRKDQRKPRCVPYLRVVHCLRVVDRPACGRAFSARGLLRALGCLGAVIPRQFTPMLFSAQP